MTPLFARCGALRLVCACVCACAVIMSVPAKAQDGPAWAVAETRTHPLVGTAWDARTGTALAQAEVLARLVGAEFVLLGEVHDNPAAHRVQAEALQALTAAGRKPAVVWEMVRRPKQPVLDHPPPEPAALGVALGWAESGWPDWSLYAPIAAVALAQGLPMLAGDLPPEALRAVARNGLATLDADIATLAQAPLSAPQRDGLLEALRSGHCGLLDAAMLAPMLPVQQARDAAMAVALLKGAARADGAVLIAGNGHTRRDWGVPHYLADAAPEARISSVGVLEVVADEVEAAAYLEPDAAGDPVYDLLWFVPRAQREDPCAGLSERLSAPK